jgi:hypothetical protein
MQTARALLLASVSACTVEAQGDRLHIVGARPTSSQQDVETLLDVGETLLADIAALHPPGTVLDDEVRVELHGRFRRTSPYVDDEGTVHLWRFSNAEGGYRALYAHELVHAIAYDSLVAPALDRSAFAGFYLEGWAEYVALLVDPGKTGFSLFGFDEDVVVGHWLKTGGPTLAEYRDRHDELNLPCQGQAYILRASWFRYVDEELGRDVLHTSWQPHVTASTPTPSSACSARPSTRSTGTGSRGPPPATTRTRTPTPKPTRTPHGWVGTGPASTDRSAA